MVEHVVKLQGATINGATSKDATNSSPVLLGRSDPDFLAAVLREYHTASLKADPKDTVVPGGGGSPVALLYPPVQRMMYVALMEAFCETPGQPRLDHSKIDSAGIVIRRVPLDSSGKKSDFGASSREGWMQDSQGGVGWRRLNVSEQKLDPDPTRRRLLHTGQSYLDKVLGDRLNSSPRSEAVSPAFAAPPDVCAPGKGTLIYALLPLASSEISKAPPPQALKAPSSMFLDDNDLLNHLPALLKTSNPIAPLAGKTVTPDYASEEYLRNNLSAQDQNNFKQFLILLNTMAIEFCIFDDNPTPESSNLLTKLNELSVTFAVPTSSTPPQLGEFLREAKAVLLDADPNAPPPPPTLEMPNGWPILTSQQLQGILDAVRAVVQQRLSKMCNQRGRYQDPGRVYEVRAFLRVKHDEQCPPRIVWSDPSSPFCIAPWYEGPGIPTPPVVLPDPTDRKALKKLKPNVSFGVPAGLFNAMQGASLDDLIKGKKPGGGGGPGLDWICGFNIPIITICAFLVLNIFLSLLNIIFFWLPLVKICIPIPKGTLNSD